MRGRPASGATFLGPRKPLNRPAQPKIGTKNGQAPHALRQDLGRPSGRRAAGRHLPHLYRPPSRPRGDEPAGLRGAAPGRPQGARAGEDAGRGRPQRADHRPHQAQSRSGERRADRLSGARTPSCSASNISTSSTSARASSTSSAPSRALRCPAPPSCAATATPRPTARSARSPTASAPRRSSMCWRRRR